MDKAEYERRYVAHLVKKGEIDEEGALASFESMDYSEYENTFPDNPEEAAEEEMSCWGDDDQ